MNIQNLLHRDKIIIRRISFAVDFEWEVFGTGKWEDHNKEDCFKTSRQAFEYAYKWCEECRLISDCEIMWVYEQIPQIF